MDTCFLEYRCIAGGVCVQHLRYGHTQKVIIDNCINSVEYHTSPAYIQLAIKLTSRYTAALVYS